MNISINPHFNKIWQITLTHDRIHLTVKDPSIKNQIYIHKDLLPRKNGVHGQIDLKPRSPKQEFKPRITQVTPEIMICSGRSNFRRVIGTLSLIFDGDNCPDFTIN